MPRFFLFLCLFLFSALLAGCQDSGNKDSSTKQMGGDFSLQSSQGAVSLSKDFQHHVVLLFFGYTHCPDVCPATLSHIAAALKSLDDKQREQVQVLFVSVDPKRDSLQKMDTYTSFFHPDIMALTGSDEQIQAVASQYQVEYFIPSAEKASENYEVMHSSFVFVLNSQGEILDLMSHHTPADAIADVMRTQLETLNQKDES